MPAPVGNKYAEGNDGGRPPLYTDPETLQKKIDEYFNTPGQKITICGLTYHLGFCSRFSFYDYEKKEEFSHIIKTARLRVEMKYEEKLSDNNCTGAIFALKNMSWKDRSESEVKVTGGVNLIIHPQDGNDPISD